MMSRQMSSQSESKKKLEQAKCQGQTESQMTLTDEGQAKCQSYS